MEQTSPLSSFSFSFAPVSSLTSYLYVGGLVIVVIVLLLGLLGYFTKGVKEKKENVAIPVLMTGSAASAEEENGKKRGTERTKEAWCLVGEDVSGRYCVKVPSESSCVPDRTHRSQEECELTPASRMPLALASSSE